MFDAIISVLFVGMDNGFGIALSAKMMPTLAQFFLQLAVVIDFTIEHNEYALIFVEDRLLSTCHVNDREATHAKRGPITHPGSLIIWSTVTNHHTHALYQLLGALATLHFVNKTGNTTHKLYPFVMISTL